MCQKYTHNITIPQNSDHNSSNTAAITLFITVAKIYNLFINTTHHHYMFASKYHHNITIPLLNNENKSFIYTILKQL